MAMSDANTPVNPETSAATTIQANRLPTSAELLKKTEEFVVDVMQTIPEVHAVAVIPVWTSAPEDMPPALLRFRNPNEPPMPAVIQLLQNISKFGQGLNRELFAQYQMFDNHARELTSRVQELSGQVQSLENDQTNPPTAG